VRLSKLMIIASVATIFTAQTAAPALAWGDDWDGHGRGHWGDRDDHGWGDGDDHGPRHFGGWGNGWGGREHFHGNNHGGHSSFQVVINQGFGQDYGYGPRYGYGYGPYRTYRRPPPAPYYDEETGNVLGTLFGGVVGGIAGSHIGNGSGRTAAIIGGTLIGAIVGGNLGRPYDQMHAANVFEVTPSNQTVAWQNPDDGIAYQVTPVRTYQMNNGQYCREYQAQASIGGRQQQTYGTACRTPDGDWQIMN
jgi:surface antigen